MSCQKSFLLAFAAGCTVLATVPLARAQAAIPAEPDPPGKNDWTDTPTPQTSPDEEPTYDSRHTTTTPPPVTHGSDVSTTTTTSADYDYRAGAEQEQTYRPNRPMLVTGAALFLAPYVTGVIVAAQSDLDADKRNYIPVVGPWLDLGQRPCSFGSDCSTGDKVGSAFLISSGVAQGVGVILAAISLGVPEHHTTTRRTAPSTTTAVQVMPLSFARGGGLGAFGTF